MIGSLAKLLLLEMSLLLLNSMSACGTTRSETDVDRVLFLATTAVTALAGAEVGVYAHRGNRILYALPRVKMSDMPPF